MGPITTASIEYDAFTLTPSLFLDIPHHLSKIDVGMALPILLGGDLFNITLDQLFSIRTIIPQWCRNRLQIKDIFRGTWPTVCMPFITATAYQSSQLSDSAQHGNSESISVLQIS